MTNEELRKVVLKYLSNFQKEGNKLRMLLKQLEEKDSIVERSNFLGHVTASGIIINENSILLIFHNFLQRYIQPGGHCEEDDSIVSCAEREVREETGLSVTLHSWHVRTELPFHIDTHIIPENRKKGEPEHYHHDFIYLFSLAGKKPVALQSNEVANYKWVDTKYSFKDAGLRNAVQKAKEHGLLI